MKASQYRVLSHRVVAVVGANLSEYSYGWMDLVSLCAQDGVVINHIYTLCRAITASLEKCITYRRPVISRHSPADSGPAAMTQYITTYNGREPVVVDRGTFHGSRVCHTAGLDRAAGGRV